ncbi:MAG: ATP-binding protein [bacterium]
MEAFSYSVSHDLRAPVRRIEGLCTMLGEDYEKQLDEAGRDLLSRITGSTVLMNTLIEDMLKLSRITRQSVTKAPCDISEMAGKICEDVRLTYPEKVVICNIEEGMRAEADSNLMQIALQNLIDNAFKYSYKAEHPEVTIGSEMKENKRVIFVRDNGVGFDMSRAGKLFTPFQRLHSDEEFKGSGIGLATVKRIIVKHGGSIHAESEPGKGTTFFFTFE